MKAHQKLEHKYLGMTLDFAPKHRVKISMNDNMNLIIGTEDITKLKDNQGFVQDKLHNLRS